MAFYPLRSILSVMVQLNYSPTLNTAISLIFFLVRTIISVTLVSPYCTDIGQITEGMLVFSALLIIRLSKFKIVDKTLTLKKNIPEQRQEKEL